MKKPYIKLTIVSICTATVVLLIAGLQNAATGQTCNLCYHDLACGGGTCDQVYGTGTPGFPSGFNLHGMIKCGLDSVTFKDCGGKAKTDECGVAYNPEFLGRLQLAMAALDKNIAKN
jgi:hypothetical protein